MLSRYHIRLIIEGCREMGYSGLKNGVSALIPKLDIDILTPPHDFLGVNGNPAIFINKHTYKLLGSHHKDWVVNRTIALKRSLLQQATIEIIGAIVHETGHAFNVAAKIENTESNAYIYEIEVMRKLFETNSPLLFGCTFKDMHTFFKGRLNYYEKGTSSNEYLGKLVEDIRLQFKLDEDLPSPKPIKSIGAIIFLNNSLTLFAQKQWKKENAMILTTFTSSL